MRRSSHVLGPEPQHEADDQQLAGSLRSRHDRLRILQRERDRLLNQHVLAGGERALGSLAVLGCGQADVDHADVCALEWCVEVVRGIGPAQGGDARGAVLRARGDDRHPCAPRERRPGPGMRLAHEATAEDRDVDHPRPSACRCACARCMAAVTSASGGQGSPWNSISTERGPL